MLLSLCLSRYIDHYVRENLFFPKYSNCFPAASSSKNPMFPSIQVGGNAVGIFIHSVEIDSAAFESGLRSADQILEYNAVDLRSATAEQAAYELAKPAEKVSILVQYNPDSKY